MVREPVQIVKSLDNTNVYAVLYTMQMKRNICPQLVQYKLDLRLSGLNGAGTGLDSKNVWITQVTKYLSLTICAIYT